MEPNRMEKKYASAIAQLTAFLDEVEPLCEDEKHYVHLWAAEDYGPRISEFGRASAHGGAAILRSDRGAATCILAAEEFLLMAACDWPEKSRGLEEAKAHLRALYT